MISEFAKGLQGKQVKCILDKEMRPDDPMIKMLADRAASRVDTVCGVLTGKAMSVDGERLIYWAYTWDVGNPDDMPMFMMSHKQDEYDRWMLALSVAREVVRNGSDT